MPPVISKLPEVGTTIFTVMSSLAKEHDAVNLGQGFPDFAMNEALIAKVNEAMVKGCNQYTHMNGYMPLREVLAEKIGNLYGASINPDMEITVTPGGTYAIYTALTSVLQPGDEVIIFQPGYDSYIPNVVINGATPVLIPLHYPDYSIDWEAVRNAVSSRTRMIMLNSPHNPTGAILRENDIAALRTIVKGTNIFILSDEVYEHVIFDALPHHSMLRYPDLLERSFVCFSFGKIYHCTGWKIGYCVAPAGAMAEFRKVHQFNCFSTDTPKQVALASFLKQKDQYESLGDFIQQKRDYFLQLMKDTKFRMHNSYGSYFILGSYGHFSDETEKDMAIRITKDHKVATIPVSAFYQTPTDNKVLRFCFCKKSETLEKAAERLRRV
ncbi:methionine aminotransferase [Agriterribacter sp.]|uniref:methionine aminotransferase n=1 Tax=Agriterribacter sp. TaxID=2821509 RepID=UPI002C716300|nr:methionine aminotransferase [Agriterribacter sp.]HRO45300.1 methionine aminotransferase [Agriterribacter sp.]HRQ17139.1 methionine aminotransferase [Agriterribacter sp.]